MGKKMLYVAMIRLPTEKAHGAQIVKTCEALADQGIEVTLLIPGRDTPIKETAFAYYNAHENFKLIALNTPDWTRWGSFGFALSSVWFSEVAKWRKEFWASDVIYSRDAFVLLQYILLGRHLVYEAHTKPTWVSRFIARHAHRVVVISEGLRDAYRACGVRSERIVVAHDSIDLNSFARMPSRAEARERLGLSQSEKVALYVGRVDAAKGVPTLAAASTSLPDGTRVVVIGSGPLKDSLQKEFPKVLFLPETPYRDLSQVLAAADVLIAPNSASDIDASIYTSPLKAFAYLAAKKPIIASDVPALRSIFGDEVTYVHTDDSEDLARAIQNPNTYLRVPNIAPYTWLSRAQAVSTGLWLT